jgi:hypothetical protein
MGQLPRQFGGSTFKTFDPYLSLHGFRFGTNEAGANIWKVSRKIRSWTKQGLKRRNERYSQR